MHLQNKITKFVNFSVVYRDIHFKLKFHQLEVFEIQPVHLHDLQRLDVSLTVPTYMYLKVF